MVASAKAGMRHVVLFADAADSRQHPGDYRGWSPTASRPASRSAWSGWAASRMRRRHLERHCPAGRRPVHVHQRGPGTAPALRPGHLRDCPQLVHRRADRGPKPTGGLKSITPPAAARVSRRSAATISAISEPGSTWGVVSADENTRRCWPPGRPVPGRVLCYTGEAEREIHRRDGRLGQGGQLLLFPGPLDGRQVAGTRAGSGGHARAAQRRLPRRVAPGPRPRQRPVHAAAGA